MMRCMYLYVDRRGKRRKQKRRSEIRSIKGEAKINAITSSSGEKREFTQLEISRRKREVRRSGTRFSSSECEFASCVTHHLMMMFLPALLILKQSEFPMVNSKYPSHHHHQNYYSIPCVVRVGQFSKVNLSLSTSSFPPAGFEDVEISIRRDPLFPFFTPGSSSNTTGMPPILPLITS